MSIQSKPHLVEERVESNSRHHTYSTQEPQERASEWSYRSLWNERCSAIHDEMLLVGLDGVDPEEAPAASSARGRSATVSIW